MCVSDQSSCCCLWCQQENEAVDVFVTYAFQTVIIEIILNIHNCQINTNEGWEIWCQLWWKEIIPQNLKQTTRMFCCLTLIVKKINASSETWDIAGHTGDAQGHSWVMQNCFLHTMLYSVVFFTHDVVFRNEDTNDVLISSEQVARAIAQNVLQFTNTSLQAGVSS